MVYLIQMQGVLCLVLLVIHGGAASFNLLVSGPELHRTLGKSFILFPQYTIADNLFIFLHLINTVAFFIVNINCITFPLIS